MTYRNNCDINNKIKTCLMQLDNLFQWLVAVENKFIEKDGIKMGSNFAKYKRIPEYIDFIQPACEAEKNFSDGNYHGCGNSCRFSLEAFTDYIYKKNGLIIDDSFFFVDKKTGTKVKDTENPTGYKLTTGWLDAKISSSSFQNYFKEKNAFPLKREKKLAAQFSHYNKDTDYNAKDALSILSMIYNLYSHCIDNQYFSGTPRFDISLLENTPKELIEPQLSIEINGKEEMIPQNNLLKAVLSKTVTEAIIKENLTNINKTDLLGNTPLTLAVYNDDLSTVKILLENGADPNFYFDKLNSDIEAHRCIPLIVAIKKDNVDILDLLLQYSARTWDSRIDEYYGYVGIPPECSTVLACAFYYNAKKCIRFLLNKNIGDINESTVSGVTPLLLAVENGLFVEKLLEKGAKIDLLDNCKNSVFLHAVQNMRHNYVLLEKLLEKAKSDLSNEALKNLLNHTGNAGCPISYMDKDEADLFLEYGADINAKNEMGVSCIVDVAYLNPEYIPWFKSKGAKFDIKAFFSVSSFLELKYDNRYRKYNKQFFTEVVTNAFKYGLITQKDLDFTVSIDDIPRISILVNAILFSKVRSVLANTKYGIEENEIGFLSESQLNELKAEYPVINELSKIGGEISSYWRVKDKYNSLVKWINEGFPVIESHKELSYEEIKELPKEKLDFNIDMPLEDVFNAIASVKELSKAQRIALFEKYEFIKKLEKKGIETQIPEEVEANYNTEWEMTPNDIRNAIRKVREAIPYEDVKISPLDDALIGKNFDTALIYLTVGIPISELTKTLLLSIHDISEKDICAWNKIHAALKLRKDIDFSGILLTLCKNHPKEDFDIAEEFINNGYNFYRFANYNLSDFWKETLISSKANCCYDSRLHSVRNDDGSYNKSPSNEDVRKRNNSSFLNYFDETSFQEVNLRLIKNAVSFGANPNMYDDMNKTAFDYAKENGIEESLLKEDDLSLNLPTGVICKIFQDRKDKTKIFNGQIDYNGEKYNFQKILLNLKKEAVAYNDAYKGKTVTFQIVHLPEDDNPGVADKVTLIES